MPPAPTHASTHALIVVPTYNERDNIPGIADRLLPALPGAEILFVDDNSPDGTGALLDEMAAADPRVHVMHRAGKLGLGTAYVEGFGWGLARGYDYLFEMDADGSHDPRYLAQMAALAEDGADVVVGRATSRGAARSTGGWAASSCRAAGASTPAPCSGSTSGTSRPASCAGGAPRSKPSTCRRSHRMAIAFRSR
jgi:dolichol-phosphate mannosyltransferase